MGLWHRALPLCTPHVLCVTRNVRAKSQETGALPLLVVDIVEAGQTTEHYKKLFGYMTVFHLASVPENISISTEIKRPLI